MIPNKIRTGLLAAAFCLAVWGLIFSRDGRCEKNSPALSREDRARVNYVLTLNEGDLHDLIITPRPDEEQNIAKRLQERMLVTIEKKQSIKITRPSMVKTDKCLHELLSGITHLTKISSGRKIVRAVIRLEGSTTRASIWSKWEVRKLETPRLTITLHYDDPAVAPSENSCQGHQYH